MKLLFLLLLPVFSLAQTNGDTKISVKVSDTSGIYNRVVSYLYESGYTLERKDGDVLLTDERVIERINTVYKIRVLFSGDKIVFSSTMKVNGMDASFVDTRFTKGKSFYRSVWDITDDIAKHFGSVSYSR